MNNAQLEIAVWVASALLAVLYLIAGGTKAVSAKETLQAQPRMAYIRDLSAAQVTAIGLLEVAGAVGVILPRLTGILPWVSAVAAFALAVVQVVAIVVHLRRGEHSLVFNGVLLVLALAVGAGLLVVL
jgi:hypothetical protein